ALGTLQLRTRGTDQSACLLFLGGARFHLLDNAGELRLQRLQFACGRLTIGDDADAERLSFPPLQLGALAARLSVALALLRHGELAAQLCHLLPLRTREAGQLVPARLGGGAP